MKNISSPNFRIRRSDERGHADHGWLDARHSFSFGNYYDPAHMGYHSLRVINEDRVSPGKGFGMHPHSSMEIFTYIISGELEHKDSMGNGRVIKAGEFQYMSAGSGVMHAEANPSDTHSTHLLQIWITPDEADGEPKYADMDTNALKRENALTLFASGDGRHHSVQMRRNAEIYFGHVQAGKMIRKELSDSLPHAWTQMIKGELNVLDTTLYPGDSAAIDHTSLSLHAGKDSEFLLFLLS
jgi:redox-sensitive bicupin YhaK (pirin superfamily)